MTTTRRMKGRKRMMSLRGDVVEVPSCLVPFEGLNDDGKAEEL